VYSAHATQSAAAEPTHCSAATEHLSCRVHVAYGLRQQSLTHGQQGGLLPHLASSRRVHVAEGRGQDLSAQALKVSLCMQAYFGLCSRAEQGLWSA
jgi:hypothetical protein